MLTQETLCKWDLQHVLFYYVMDWATNVLRTTVIKGWVLSQTK